MTGNGPLPKAHSGFGKERSNKVQGLVFSGAGQSAACSDEVVGEFEGKAAKRRLRRMQQAAFEAAARLAAPAGAGNRNAATVPACAPSMGAQPAGRFTFSTPEI